MNASNTIIRKATELGVGNRIVIGGEIHTIVEIHDLPANSFGAFVSFRLENGGGVIEAARTLYTVVGA